MIRFLSHFLRLAIMTAVLLLAFFCISVAVMQTKWAKETIRTKLISEFQEKGVSLEIEGLDGRLPFTWTIERIQCRFSPEQSLTLLHSKVRLKILPLFRKHLSISYLNIREADYVFTESPQQEQAPLPTVQQLKKGVQDKLDQARLAFHLSIQNLKIEQLNIENKTRHETYSFRFSAYGKWRKSNAEFHFNGKLSSLPDHPSIYAELFIHGNQAKKEISTGFKTSIEEINNFSFLCPVELTGNVLIEATLAGPWDTWKALIWEDTPTGSALIGKLKSRVQQLNIPQYPLLNRDWLLRTDLLVQADKPLILDRFQLLSNFLCLKAKVELASQWEESFANVEFAISDLSPFSPYVHTPVSGKVNGKATYQADKLVTSFGSTHIQVDRFAWERVHGALHASHQKDLWLGDLELTANEGILPFASKLSFHWDPQLALQISDLSIKTEGATVNGELKLATPDLLWQGALYAQISQITPLLPFIGNPDLEGGLGIECSITTDEINGVPEQNVRLEILSQNIRYASYTIQKFSLFSDLHAISSQPYGRISLHADNVHTPHFFLNQLTLNASSDRQQWPFSFAAWGNMYDPFEITVSGSCKSQGQAFDLNLEEIQGKISERLLALEKPCQIHWSPSHLKIADCTLKVGDGFFQGSCDFSEKSANAAIDIRHFPLGVLSIFRPNFVLEGSLAACGFLEATEEDIKGSLNVALEQADLLYYGKEEPLQAKGSVQIHLDHHVLQCHSSLNARGEQFVDLTASVPVEHQIYPFQLKVNPEEKLSGELIAEGKVEDIFDFINIGSHNVTGLISCRLLLSQTFNSPVLQGSIDWENGSYENHYTGTTLKEIQVHLQADKDTLKLTSLKAHDDSGTLSATGQLKMKPNQKFRYEISAELDHLNALRFDMIDADLTGPLYITGNTDSAMALGNLILPKATIRIPDKLPYEIPNVPFTFINRPSHLAPPQMAALPVFPLHIDFDVTAEDKVFVEGKGLKSEWKGSGHLSGTNMAVAVDGKLDLINGEYSFVGKTFKLTEGQIIFNDKPTPSAYLTLSGILSLQDVEITANLSGPLTSPQLTFQSNPHMPTSAILSRILFNKDIGDISQTEAIQLAATLMDLSGGATPSVMEMIRKTLGIDRLTIVPSEKNEIALQIGKYLTKGVMVTLSQSATSTQVIVEVELKKGFVFQAETQEEQEGKFSLKWRRNY